MRARRARVFREFSPVRVLVRPVARTYRLVSRAKLSGGSRAIRAARARLQRVCSASTYTDNDFIGHTVCRAQHWNFSYHISGLTEVLLCYN